MMEWIKIFNSEHEAKQRIQNDSPQLLIVHGKRICLVKHNDQFHAVQDQCTHSGASLSAGKVNYLGEIICPLHSYCFNTTTGSELSNRSPDLTIYSIRIGADGFFVGLSS